MVKTFSVFLVFLLALLTTVYATDANISIFYGWNGSTFLPVLTDASGKLQTDFNITTSSGMNPKVNNTINLGSLVRIWANIYTNSIRSVSTLSIFAGSTEAITILSNGFVGIGVSNSTERLMINGNISFTNGPRIMDDNGRLKIQAGGATNGTTSSIYFLDSVGVVRGRFEMNYSSGVDIVTFTDTNQTNFNTGTYNNTMVSGENATFVSDFGDGSDGNITVTAANFIMNNYTNILHNVTIGATSINVTDNSSFFVDDEILIIQMQNASAGVSGKYEYRKITSISNKTLSFTLGLANSYYNSPGSYNTSTSTVTQVVRIPQYTDVNISGSGSIVAPAWNGSVGGLIIFKATGIVNISGVINASEKGFGGGTSGSTGPQYIKGRWTSNGDNGDNSPISASCTPSNIAGGNGGSCTLGVRSAGAATGGASLSSPIGHNPGNNGLGSTRPVANATGGTVTYSGNYTIHTFTTNGTFNVTLTGTVEVLVVAGGGGGGSGRSSPGGGGGGGGGVIYNSSFNVTIQNYIVIVGTGGPGSTALSERGKQGSNSSFDSLIAVGGGGGGSYGATNPGGAGGSGGGSTYGAAIGTGTAGQGYDGGKGTGADPLGESGGGGGGASGVGANASTNSGGAGGTGVGKLISGSYAYYGGGGGGGSGYPSGGSGGAGGSGGGGGGGGGASGTSATANTGGGGGGAGSNWPTASTNGGNGGSGIVIIRYATPPVSGGNAGGGGGSSGGYYNDPSGAGGTGYEGGGGGGSYGYNFVFYSTGAGGGCPYKFDITDPAVITTNDTSLINFGAGAPAGAGGGASSGSGGCGYTAATAGTGGGANGSAGIAGGGNWVGYTGYYGGNGSSGGGIIIIHASNINAAASSILADGGPGGYGGNGTDAHDWSGGGGGGAGAQGAAGGTIKILSNSAALANNAVLARGGPGGKGGYSKWGSRGPYGGVGGAGATFVSGNDMGSAGTGGGTVFSNGGGWGGGGAGGNSGYGGKIIISLSNSSVSNPAAVNYSTSETYQSGTMTDANVTLNLSFTATGGTITYSGGYTIHTFTNNGTFNSTGAGTVEYIVVGGGGGGGSSRGGGGGAGGFRTGNHTISAQSYSVLIGGGGAVYTNGSSSVFGNVTSLGGGRGGNYAAAGLPGDPGGSGGGGGSGEGPAGFGGAGTAGEGYRGGDAYQGGAGKNIGGGGGGAGGVGGNGTSTLGGNGGPGINSSITGVSVGYAGGGGGSHATGGGGTGGGYATHGGGNGGGDYGSGNIAGVSGTANTGGGGGGAGDAGGGTGGSGIVVVRYPTIIYITGNYTSRVFDANQTVIWSFITWSNITPAGTAIILKTRTSANNVTFSDWMNHTTSPSAITQNSSNRYLQYQAILNTTNASVTPYILNASVNYSTVAVVSSANTYGTLYTGSMNTAAADLAEYYATDELLEAGDVVSVSNEKLTLNGKEITTRGVLRKSQSAYDKNIIGAVSTTPGLILGSYAPEGKSLLALAGRTPVKISAENGPIDIGDYLTSSSQPGIAMKATEPGVVIGRALETGGADKIEVLVGTKESNFVGDINARQEQIDKLTRQNQQIRERISVLEAILSKKG